MKTILLIRIPPPVSEVRADTIVQWGQFTGGGDRQSAIHVTTIDDLRHTWLQEQSSNDEEEEMLPEQVVLLLPGGVALHKQVVMDAGQRKHMTTALPYLVEEEVAQDIESMHLASYQHKKDDLVSLSVIPHEDMQALLSLFEQVGLPLDSVITEAQLIEPEPGFTTLLLDEQAVLLSSPSHAQVCLDYEALRLTLSVDQLGQGGDSMLNDLVEDSSKPHHSQIKLYYSDGEFAPSSELIENLKTWLDEQGWLVDEVLLDESVFDHEARQYFINGRAGKLIDLRQGAYQCPHRAGRQIKRWKPVVAVLSCWLLLELGMSAGQAYMYQYQTEALWEKSINDYLSLFPQDQQAKSALAKHQVSFNVQKVLENRLRSGSKKQSTQPFLPLLQKVSTISEELGPEAKLDHRSMDFNESTGQLVLEFQTESLETVDKFLAALNESGLSTKLHSANQGKTNVLARMTIGR